MKFKAYKISNGIRHGERKTLEGAKTLASKYQKTSRNHVSIDMVYYDEKTNDWKCKKIQ